MVDYIIFDERIMSMVAHSWLMLLLHFWQPRPRLQRKLRTWGRLRPLRPLRPLPHLPSGNGGSSSPLVGHLQQFVVQPNHPWLVCYKIHQKADIRSNSCRSTSHTLWNYMWMVWVEFLSKRLYWPRVPLWGWTSRRHPSHWSIFAWKCIETSYHNHSYHPNHLSRFGASRYTQILSIFETARVTSCYLTIYFLSSGVAYWAHAVREPPVEEQRLHHTSGRVP